jgi:hypothetical protein
MAREKKPCKCSIHSFYRNTHNDLKTSIARRDTIRLSLSTFKNTLMTWLVLYINKSFRNLRLTIRASHQSKIRLLSIRGLICLRDKSWILRKYWRAKVLLKKKISLAHSIKMIWSQCYTLKKILYQPKMTQLEACVLLK